ncbi:MAG: hypothetical protein HIU57_06045 [Acidobacteria bacterium]|nr:hypothetical protein [Acidobacteriota bacterium]
MDESREVPAHSSDARLRGSEAVRLHLTLALGLVLCAAAFWFELKRALGGNALSWAYVFEWPLLGIFAVYMWSRFLHPGRETRPAKNEKVLDPSFDAMRERWEQSREELERAHQREQGSSDA